jgi:hypothetical protein
MLSLRLGVADLEHFQPNRREMPLFVFVPSRFGKVLSSSPCQSN